MLFQKSEYPSAWTEWTGDLGMRGEGPSSETDLPWLDLSPHHSGESQVLPYPRAQMQLTRCSLATSTAAMARCGPQLPVTSEKDLGTCIPQAPKAGRG